MIATCQRNMAQHVARVWPHPTCRRTHCNMVVKRTQHVAPNDSAICYVGMLRLFGRGLRAKLVQRKATPTSPPALKSQFPYFHSPG